MDDFLFGGNYEFLKDVIDPLCKVFKVGTHCDTAFRYLGLNVKQYSNSGIEIDQISYLETIEEVQIDANRKSMRDSPLSKAEIKSYRTLIGQLGWIAGQTRPDLSFDVCDLSSSVKNATIKDLLRANKVLRKGKCDCVKLKYFLQNLEKTKILCYNDASFGNLKDGGSQRGFQMLYH